MFRPRMHIVTADSPASAIGGGVFQLGAVIIEASDQPGDQIFRARMRDIGDQIGNIDHIIAVQYAQFEVIEIQNFHWWLPK